jgi:hypothetical protein
MSFSSNGSMDEIGRAFAALSPVGWVETAKPTTGLPGHLGFGWWVPSFFCKDGSCRALSSNGCHAAIFWL